MAASSSSDLQQFKQEIKEHCNEQNRKTEQTITQKLDQILEQGKEHNLKILEQGKEQNLETLALMKQQKWGVVDPDASLDVQHKQARAEYCRYLLLINEIAAKKAETREKVMKERAEAKQKAAERKQDQKALEEARIATKRANDAAMANKKAQAAVVATKKMVNKSKPSDESIFPAAKKARSKAKSKPLARLAEPVQ